MQNTHKPSPESSAGNKRPTINPVGIWIENTRGNPPDYESQRQGREKPPPRIRTLVIYDSNQPPVIVLTREVFSLDPQTKPGGSLRRISYPPSWLLGGLSHYERFKHVLDLDLSLIAKEYTPLCPYDTIIDQIPSILQVPM